MCQLTGWQNDNKTLSFTYDANGLRNTKTVNGTTTQYYYSGSQLMAQKTGSTVLEFLYDENGLAYGFVKNYSSRYYYVYNLQGDVIGLLDSDGSLVVSYEYDEWGKCLSIKTPNGTDVSGTSFHIGVQNPLRYRGYYYDRETGFYYLNSRYYDPEIGRFLNADGYVSTGQDILGNNMFAYCNNNPIKMVDPNGKDAIFYVDEDTLPIVGHAVLLFQDSLSQDVVYLLACTYRIPAECAGVAAAGQYRPSGNRVPAPRHQA